eukprot:TRINITY_DN3791_c0_g2_i1.p2 TRINITY_DN3791_c0_g2~~TRINITY_DN3791_c0_g2_i1.p2  ORF type:complete len:172 (-),score=20.18 TRINITY_DN3791_c0_g2_i1:341-856(-)
MPCDKNLMDIIATSVARGDTTLEWLQTLNKNNPQFAFLFPSSGEDYGYFNHKVATLAQSSVQKNVNPFQEVRSQSRRSAPGSGGSRHHRRRSGHSRKSSRDSIPSVTASEVARRPRKMDKVCTYMSLSLILPSPPPLPSRDHDSSSLSLSSPLTLSLSLPTPLLCAFIYSC